jgi:choline dehydrogenase-like flavoprotein
MRSRSALLFVASICAAYALTEEKRDYCIIGGGPGGLQMARLLQQAGRDYAVFEKGRVAEFFRTFPRHRRLISINKRQRTGDGIQPSPRLALAAVAS